MRTLIAVISSHAFDYETRRQEGTGVRVRTKTLLNSDSAHGTVNRRVEIVRQTWAKTLRKLRPDLDLRFFFGQGRQRTMEQIEPDEILLDVDDSYQKLPWKVQAVFKWAGEHGYDLMLKLDDDTFLPERLIQRIDENPQDAYVGCRFDGRHNIYKSDSEHLKVEIPDDLGGDPEVPAYASGGGYRLNRRALQILHQTKIHRFSFQPEGVDLADPLAIPSEDVWVGRTLRQNGIQLTVDRSYAGWISDQEEWDATVHKVIADFNATSRNENGTYSLNPQALATAVLLARLNHFNCSAEKMRQLYKEDTPVERAPGGNRRERRRAARQAARRESAPVE